jgi:Lon protease-like protein
MFPLGSVLVPHAIVSLHVFEPRYRVLMFDCTRGEPEFGVVLIERGFEVGGEEQRFQVATVARIVEAAELPDGRWFLTAVGTRRIRVLEWLPDDPYPVATVADLVEPAWSAEADQALVDAQPAVRRALALASELMAEPAIFPARQPSDDAQVAAWQLVARAPIGSLDRLRLLEIDDPVARLRRLAVLADEQAAMLAQRLNWE